MSQCRHHGDTLPGTERHFAHQPLPACHTTTPPCHAGGDRRLIDEYQPPGIELALATPPAPAHRGHVRAVLFGRVQGFFYTSFRYGAESGIPMRQQPSLQPWQAGLAVPAMSGPVV